MRSDLLTVTRDAYGRFAYRAQLLCSIQQIEEILQRDENSSSTDESILPVLESPESSESLSPHTHNDKQNLRNTVEGMPHASAFQQQIMETEEESKSSMMMELVPEEVPNINEEFLQEVQNIHSRDLELSPNRQRRVSIGCKIHLNGVQELSVYCLFISQIYYIILASK